MNPLRTIASYLSIILLVFIVYTASLFYQLTFFDDNVWLQDYLWLIKDFSFAGKIFSQPDLISKIFYRPLLSLSFILNAQIFPGSLWPFHLVNIFIHACNALLVVILFRLLGYASSLAICWGILFAVHPVHVSAVSWIPGRTDSLLAFFVLISFIFFIRFLERFRKTDLIIHLLALTAALLTKETAVALPLMCAVYLYLDNIGKFRVRHSKSREGSCFWAIALWVVILTSWGAVRSHIIRSMTTGNWEGQAVTSFVNNLPALFIYLGKIVFPFNLSVLPILKDSSLWPGIVAFIGLAALTWASKEKNIGRMIFGWTWFLLFLLPSLVFSFIKHEYRVYIPLVGIMIILSELDLVKRMIEKPVTRRVVLAIMVVLFMLLSWQHSSHYRDKWAFWENAVQTSPHSPLAHRNLGAMFYLDGKMAEAEKEYLEALKLNPREHMVHNNLALIYQQRGMFAQAETAYKEELALYPDYDNAYYNLGLLYYQTGRLKEAVWAWENAKKLNPYNQQAAELLKGINLYVPRN